MTFDALSERCAKLGYPISRVVLSKIESGFRPDVTVPELLVISRALNTSPARLVTPVGTAEQVEPLPGREMTTWEAWVWFSGHAFPEPVAPDLEPDGRTEDIEVALQLMRPFELWWRHEQLAYQWDAVTRDVAAMGLERGDELELLARRRRPVIAELTTIRRQCVRNGIALPPVGDEELQRSLAAADEASNYQLGAELYRARHGDRP